jgi:hypothetical protein
MRDVRYPEKARVWRFEERDNHKDGGGGNRNKREDGRGPSYDPENLTELDLDAISECLGSDHRIIA